MMTNSSQPYNMNIKITTATVAAIRRHVIGFIMWLSLFGIRSWVFGMVLPDSG